MNNPRIVFYEWSDINRQPIGFLNDVDFINFCNDSNILLSKRNINFMGENPVKTIYSTCKKGKNELIMSGDYKNFRKNYSKHRNG